MKRIRWIELFANIRANIVPFLSISLFVALGVALFLGIRWGGVALQDAIRREVAKGNMHDVEVQFPYGITESDLAEVRQVEGIDDLETGYSGFVYLKGRVTTQVLKIQTLTERIDVPTRVEGTLPTGPTEVAALAMWAEKQNISVGDTIELKHDAQDASDKDGMELLTTDTFTVTALIDHPGYLGRQAKGWGVSNSGSGAIDGIIFSQVGAFDTAKFRDGYPNLYIRSHALDGLDVFSQDYREAVAPIVDRVTELGGTLGTARYHEIRDEAQGKLDDAGTKISDGERQLEEGQQKLIEGEQSIADGERELADGERALAEGKDKLAAEQLAGSEKLAEGYAKLVEGQTKYDDGVQAYETARNLYNGLADKLDAVRADYDRLILLYNAMRSEVGPLREGADRLQAALDAYFADIDHTDASWAAVDAAYQALGNAYNQLVSDHGSLTMVLESVGDALGFPVPAGGIAPLPTDTLFDRDTDTALELVNVTRSSTDSTHSILDSISGANITVSDITISLLDIPGGFQRVYDQLEGTRQTLEKSKAELDAGWEEYYANKELYDQQVAEGKQQLEDSRQQLEDGRQKLEDSRQELADGKKQLSERTQQLEDGKLAYADAQDQFDKLIEYEWVVLSRLDSGGIQSGSTVYTMMDNVRWAMASLFVIVGLFVCYSAISRLVHEEIVAVGTKKALGFRGGEITLMYLLFSGMSVVIGIVLAAVLSVVLVQGVMNPTSGHQFSVPEYAPHFSLVGLLEMGGLELGLILLATWFAVHGLLRREALDLLRGESTANIKEHFYERLDIWTRSSLFSQTVINNCINDPRRVVATLVGVMGCTALIVTAVTLNGNIAQSLSRHYDAVFDFDAVAYLSGDGGKEKADAVALALHEEGISSAPVFSKRLQVRQSNGTRGVGTLVVPVNEEAFRKYYHVMDHEGGEADIDAGGIWVSAAYQSHMNASVGDEITLTESTGKTHTFEIAGFYEYRLMREEFVMSAQAYQEAFGEEAQPNMLYVKLDGADIDRVRSEIMRTEGYESLFDDYADASYVYDELNKLMRAVVVVYLLLSALMALMVLLNLDIMFINEKKRELIVLMINGFSVRQAKAYIYRDSIVLTVIGIVIGVVVGSLIGGYTVAAMEPEMGYFIKSVNWLAVTVGSVGAAVFAAAVLIYALRRIAKFDLTDINRF